MPDADQVVFVLVTVLGVPAVALVLAALPVSRARLDSFVQRYDLELDPRSAPPVVAHLTRSRRARAWGGAAGWVIGPLLLFGTEGTHPGSSALGGAAGFLVGALVAALLPARQQGADPGVRRASLLPRNPVDYLTRAAWLAPPLLAGLSLMLLSVHLVWPSDDIARPATTTVVVLALAGTALLTQRTIVRRRQAGSTLRQRSIDDALRADSAQVTTSATIALMCMGVAAISQTILRTGAPDWVAHAATLLVYLVVLLALAAWFGLRHWSHRPGLPRRRAIPR